jgi:hypothetical protein
MQTHMRRNDITWMLSDTGMRSCWFRGRGEEVTVARRELSCVGGDRELKFN